MKALPVILFLAAVAFAFIEWEHGRVHEAVLQNAAIRIQNLQTTERPAPQNVPVEIKRGPLGLARVAPHAPGKVLLNPNVLRPAPAPVTNSDVAQQIAATKAEQDKETAEFNESEKTMMTVRLILTAIFIPACFFIIFKKTLFDEKGRGFAYTTLGAILTFWLHS
jgi:hypothetical protein